MSPQDNEFKPAPQLPDSYLEMFRLKGQVAAVTGATAGIGYAVCSALAEAGADLIMFYNSNPCDKEAAEISQKYGVKAKAFQLNASKSDQCKKVINEAAQEFGRLDVFIANAGAGGPGPITDMEDDAWDKCVSTNYSSVFYCAREAGKIWKKQVAEGKPHGRFIATSSISGHIVNYPTQAAYNGAKAGVIHLCKSLAFDYREFARVNIVSPGWVHTKMGALGEEQKYMCLKNTVMARDAQPKELAGAFLYLASNASSYTTGSEIIVDGGYVLP